MKHAFAAPALDDAAGDVAGRGDRVIGVMRHAEAVENLPYGGAGPRRIGDEDHGTAAGAKARERRAGGGESRDTVVHHAPDVAQEHVIAARQRRKSINDGGQGAWRHQRVEWAGERIRRSVASAAGVNEFRGPAARRGGSGVAGNAM